MQFVFNGSLDELKNSIRTKAQEANKDIIVYHDDPTTLEIGFQRLGHSGGRFFVAHVTETDTGIVLEGDLVNIYQGKPESRTQSFWTILGAFATLYVLAELVLLIIWLPIFHFSHIWIPLILPLPAFLLLRIQAIKEDQKIDADFIAFMSAITARFCPYLNEHIDAGCCHDLQTIIDEETLLKHCQKCKMR